MSTMTQTAVSECSFTELETNNLEESIDSTSSKLWTALANVVTLQKQLRELLALKKEHAFDKIDKAKQYLKSVERQERELSGILGEDSTASTDRHSSVADPEEADSNASPMLFAADIADQSKEAGSHHSYTDSNGPHEVFADHGADLDAFGAHDNASSQSVIEDEIPAGTSVVLEVPDPLWLDEDLSHLERIDSATLSEVIKYYHDRARFLEEEERRREVARGLAMQVKAEQELADLQTERDHMIHRKAEIVFLEDRAELERQDGLRLASRYGAHPRYSSPSGLKMAIGIQFDPLPATPNDPDVI